MKNQYSFFCFLLASVLPFINLHSQDYTPFYLDSSQWYEMRITPVIGPEDNASYRTYYTTTDTMINGFSYAQIEHEKVCEVRQISPTEGGLEIRIPRDINKFTIGGLREENNRIYFYAYPIRKLNASLTIGWQGLEAEMDHLLYDFNAEIGDTIKFSPTYSSTITNGDTIIRVFHNSTIIRDTTTDQYGVRGFSVSPSSAWSYPYETGSWRQGIGSSYGLFGSYNSFLNYNTCVLIKGEPLHPSSSDCHPCNEISTSTKQSEPENLTLFPNPASTELHILYNGLQKVSMMLLYDYSGKEMAKQKLDAKEFQLTKDISEISSSILLIVFILEDGTHFTKKILKQK